MFFHQDLYDSYVHTAKLKANKLGIVLNHQPLFQTYQEESNDSPCYRPWETINISQTGNTTICCGGAGGLGNVFEEDFFKVWNSKPFRGFRQTVNSPNPPAQCKKCTRGKEDPTKIETHITYLRKMSAEDREKRIKELMGSYSTQG